MLCLIHWEEKCKTVRRFLRQQKGDGFSYSLFCFIHFERDKIYPYASPIPILLLMYEDEVLVPFLVGSEFEAIPGSYGER